MLQVRAGGRAPKFSQKVVVRVPPDVRNEEIPHPSASEGVAQKRGGELRASNVEHFATTAARCGSEFDRRRRLTRVRK